MELKVSSKIVLIDFCYSWFRLQSITIHCNRRGVDRYTSHESFSRTLSPCAHTTLWLKVSLVRIHSVHMPSMMSHVERALFVLVLSSSSLSLSPLLSLHCLPVLCPAHQLPQCRIRRKLKPLYSRTMRSIAPWRFTTLSQVDLPRRFNGHIVPMGATRCRIGWSRTGGVRPRSLKSLTTTRRPRLMNLTEEPRTLTASHGSECKSPVTQGRRSFNTR